GEAARQGGDATQALQEIQRHSFAFEQSAGAALHGGDGFAGGAAVTIALSKLQFRYSAALAVNLGENREAGDDQRLARYKYAAGQLRFGNTGKCRGIAGADVLCEGKANQFGHDAPFFGLSNCDLYSASFLRRLSITPGGAV